MKNLTLGDLLLALPDLLERRATALDGLLSAQLHLPQLEEVWAEISALPLVADAPEQFVAQLSAADARHDGFASALTMFVEAYRRIPNLSESDATLLAKAEPIVPQSGDTKDSYATQASQAQERAQAATGVQREALGDFPLRGGGSLLDLFDAYLQAGSDIDTLLRQRADAASASAKDRSRAGALRGTAIGLLGQLRAALAGELRADPERAASVDKQVFAYIDLLQDSRDKGGPAAPPPPPPATPA